MIALVPMNVLFLNITDDPRPEELIRTELEFDRSAGWRVKVLNSNMDSLTDWGSGMAL